MDVKYISADWERMRSALGKVVGAGWGTGTIDELIKLNKNLEKAESDIAKYDSDGFISFTHIDRERTFKGLDEDFNVLYRFTDKVGGIVDRTIDQPFYEDIDAFVAEIQGLTLSDYKATNRIGATTTVHVQGYQSMEVEKKEVTMEDLLNGDNFYSKQMKLEYEAWKEMTADQEITQEEYQTAALNTRAFGYESIKDGQLNKEFWVNIAAVVVIVGAALICPPAGIALGAAYGTAELSSAISGKDWVSGRELGTGERVFRGVLAPIDIFPAASAFRSFSGVARTSRVGNGVKDLGINIKTGMKNVETKAVQINDAVVTATQQGSMRIKNANAVVKERVKEIPNKLANKAVDAAKVVDETYTNTKTVFSKIGLREEFAFDGGVVRQSAENTHTVENSVKNIVGRVPGVNIGGLGASEVVKKSSIVEKPSLKSIEEFVKGTKKFDDVLDDYALIYGDIVKANRPWSWQDDFIGKLTATQRKRIKERALELHHEIPKIEVKKVEGLKFGYADFKGADVVLFDDVLPRELWLATDDVQFKWLNNRLPGKIQPEGTTWHHSELDGKMELVPFGIHNITKHNGGRTKGHWADAPR